VALGGENLIESELFGYEKGAFTGAVQRKTGLLEAANGGTLVIDEVGELPLALQSKLLRVLETGTIRRLGSSEYRHVDVRMVAATHRDLGAMVGRGEFRHDLYYRLSAFPLRIPPLRERREDIPALAEHFLARMNTRGHHRPLSTAVVRKLLRHDYPGNVRELRNIVERAHILAGEDAIHPGHIHFDLTRPPPPPSPFPAAMQGGMGRRRDALCPEEIHAALESCKGRRADAAQSLGISERTLYRHLNRLREVED
jgi:DNA-binding NtrC family response regulator